MYDFPLEHWSINDASMTTTAVITTTKNQATKQTSINWLQNWLLTEWTIWQRLNWVELSFLTSNMHSNVIMWCVACDLCIVQSRTIRIFQSHENKRSSLLQWLQQSKWSYCRILVATVRILISADPWELLACDLRVFISKCKTYVSWQINVLNHHQ